MYLKIIAFGVEFEEEFLFLNRPKPPRELIHLRARLFKFKNTRGCKNFSIFSSGLSPKLCGKESFGNVY